MTTSVPDGKDNKKAPIGFLEKLILERTDALLSIIRAIVGAILGLVITIQFGNLLNAIALRALYSNDPQLLGYLRLVLIIVGSALGAITATYFERTHRSKR